MMKRIQFLFSLLIIASSILSAQEIIRVSGQLYTPIRLITFNNKMFFVARDSAGVNLWQYDGLNAPVRYSDFNNTDYGIPFISFATEYQNRIYFSLQEGQAGSGLWRFDGINPPEEIIPQSGFLSSPRDFTAAGNMLYFNADDQVHGMELWVYDGINPPHMVDDILLGDSEHGISSNPYNLTAFGSKICFVADDGVHGNELWEYDGVNPAHLVRDIYKGANGSYISNLLTFNNKLYFDADDSIHGRELWVYDGTHDPSIVSDLYPGSVSSNPNSLFVYKEKLYFGAEDNSHGKRLWSFDGTNQPSLVSESFIWSADYTQSPMIIFNDKLFFSGRDEFDNGELWEYDGVSEPRRTFAFGPDPRYDTYPRNFMLNANRLYFTVGLKLYVYDDIHHPVPLADLSYNYEPSHAMFEPDLISMNNKLYMISFDPEKKEGLYVLSDAHSEITVASCGAYEFNGNVLTQAGTYIDTIPNYYGADSIITLSLTFNTLDIEVIQDQAVLISKDSLDAHQWINCDNGYAPIAGETGRIFTANGTGHYAVIVSNGECVDTSAIYAITINGFDENTFSRNISLYPNPSDGFVSLDLGKEYAKVEITITAVDGRIQNKYTLKHVKVTSLNLPEHAGIYIVMVTSGNERAVFRIVKK